MWQPTEAKGLERVDPSDDQTENELSDKAALEHARAELREKLHREWLWGMFGRVSKWALAVIAGVTVVADAAIRVWRALTGQ